MRHGGASAERERKHPGKGVEKTVHTRHLNVCILRGSLCRNIFERDHCCSAFRTRAHKSLEVRFFVSCGHRIAYMKEQNVIVCMYRNFALKRLPKQTCICLLYCSNHGSASTYALPKCFRCLSALPRQCLNV